MPFIIDFDLIFIDVGDNWYKLHHTMPSYAIIRNIFTLVQLYSVHTCPTPLRGKTSSTSEFCILPTHRMTSCMCYEPTGPTLHYTTLSHVTRQKCVQKYNMYTLISRYPMLCYATWQDGRYPNCSTLPTRGLTSSR